MVRSKFKVGQQEIGEFYSEVASSRKNNFQFFTRFQRRYKNASSVEFYLENLISKCCFYCNRIRLFTLIFIQPVWFCKTKHRNFLLSICFISNKISSPSWFTCLHKIHSSFLSWINKKVLRVILNARRKSVYLNEKPRFSLQRKSFSELKTVCVCFFF